MVYFTVVKDIIIKNEITERRWSRIARGYSQIKNLRESALDLSFALLRIPRRIPREVEGRESALKKIFNINTVK